MRFSKSSIKTHIMRGATSQQAKSRSGQTGPWILWKELKRKEIKYLQQFGSQGLPKDYQAGNGFYQNFKSKYLFSIGQKAEKTSQTSGFQLQIKERIFQAMLHFWFKKEHLNCHRSHLKPPSRDLARTVYAAENLTFTSFSATSGIQWLWVKIGKKSSDWYPSIKN